MSVFEKIYFIFDVNSVSSTYSLYKITNGDDQKVTKNTIYCEICIICPLIGKWSILYIIQKYYKKYQNIFAKTRVLFKTFFGQILDLVHNKVQSSSFNLQSCLDSNYSTNKARPLLEPASSHQHNTQSAPNFALLLSKNKFSVKI